jgi:hypothetical protein
MRRRGVRSCCFVALPLMEKLIARVRLSGADRRLPKTPPGNALARDPILFACSRDALDLSSYRQYFVI